MGQELSDLQGLSIPNVLTFEEGPSGLLRAAIFTPHAEATVYLQGAHVTHYRPTGQKPLLFTSAKSSFAAGQAIRGGVPVCFPWFGFRGDDPASPMHGFARVLPWTVESADQGPDKSLTLTLRLDPSEETRRLWPHEFALWHRITVGPSLDLALEIRNTSEGALVVEEAFHTYLAVADVRQVSIVGLANTTYIDKTLAMARKTEGEAPITIVGETDRRYLNTRARCIVEDPVLARRITIEKSGSDSSILWNPWIEKAKAMADFGDDEWPRMLCVESGNVLDNALALPSGGHHTLQVRYISEPR